MIFIKKLVRSISMIDLLDSLSSLRIRNSFQIKQPDTKVLRDSATILVRPNKKSYDPFWNLTSDRTLRLAKDTSTRFQENLCSDNIFQESCSMIE